MSLFKWEDGRQETFYQKMLLLRNRFFIDVDMWLLKYPKGAYLPPHTDKCRCTKRHYRINIILKKAKKGGEFISSDYIFNTSRIKFFRSDLCEHSLTTVEEGRRIVLSIGWTMKARKHH